MSASSGSYVAGADIIDLDRYMRASVRPSRHGRAYTRERLVVDAGGADRVPVVASSDSDAPPSRSATRYKRYSHDSGLSDDTYVKRKHKPRRRTSENKYESSRNVASNFSVREFRAACEKTLREQQEQIARVTEICERLVQPQMAQHIPENVTNEPNRIDNSPQILQNIRQRLNHEENNCKVNQNSDKQNFGQNVTQKFKRPATSDSSDVTSSNSSRHIRRKDKHRSESCKTYNLIMGKLDELSHLFATRRAPPAPRAGPRASSGSVSVCDKLVATDDVRRFNTPVIQVMHSSRLSDRARSEGIRSIKRQLAVTRAPAVDIAPVGRDGGEESIVEHWWESAGVAAGAFDLDDPLHLYAQAKRLQALHASARRKSTDRPCEFDDKFGDQLDDQSCDKSGVKSDASLCALCRGYCRVVWRYLKQQLFGTIS